MAFLITPTHTFTPGSAGVGTLNLSGIPSFDIQRLVAVINITRKIVLYAPSVNAPSVSGTTLTLDVDTTGHNSADKLFIKYDDPQYPIGTVYGSTNKVAVTPTVTAATYAVSKCIGGIMTFSNILPPNTYGALLESITLKFKATAQTVGFYVSLFDSSPGGTFTDTTTCAIAAADTAKLLGIYYLTGGVGPLGTHTIYRLSGIGDALQGASQNLYAVVSPDATTVAMGSTSEMTLTLSTIWG